MLHTSPSMPQLLARVARRMYWQRMTERWRWCFLSVSIAYVVLVLVSRGVGYGAEWWALWQIPALAVLALGLSWLTVRRPRPQEVARETDRAAGLHDLFLTATLLSNAAGEFQPLVQQSANEAATRVKPEQVVTFRWQRPVEQALITSVVLLVAVLWMPQFDPFGVVAQAEAAEVKHEELNESVQATEKRLAELKQAAEENESQEKIEKAVEELKLALGKLSPGKTPENRQMLNKEQAKLGNLWKEFSTRQLQELANRNQAEMTFGQLNSEELQKWGEDLKMGKTDSLKQQIDEIKAKLERLAKTEDPIERAELEQELKKDIQQMKEFARNKTNSKPLQEALNRALKQLEAMKDPESREEAEKALEKSLELTKQEMERIGMSAEEIKRLEEALEVLQQAKALNEQNKLNDESTGEMTSLEDYAAMYAEMMEGMMEGEEGDGDGGGQGSDPEAEDDSVKSGFKSETAKSAVKAGKMILELKTKGLGAQGEVHENYQQAIQNVKQGVSEAILQEQVPPGYHETIKNYFNTLTPMPKAQPSAPPAAPAATKP